MRSFLGGFGRRAAASKTAALDAERTCRTAVRLARSSACRSGPGPRPFGSGRAGQNAGVGGAQLAVYRCPARRDLACIRAGG